LYEDPIPVDSESDEFQAPFYLIANLAIGGAFTDAYNLGDPGSGAPVSMSFPAEMYVDYVRVYQWNGQGEVHQGPPAQKYGTFGIYTDNTPVDDELVAELTSEIYVWEGTLIDGSLPAYEGENALSWQTAGSGWFGAGIMSIQPLNLFEFGDGHLNFMIKIPAHVTFKIGIIDAWGNQSYVEFPAHQTTYGLIRNGDWAQASIPVSDLRGLSIDLRMLSYSFVILEEGGVACEFALDDIYWSGGATTGLEVDEVVPEHRMSLHANTPNPFNAKTQISFELAKAGVYELAIYDVAGRRVASFGGIGTAGLNQMLWDGRSDTGAVVGSGAYYYSLKTADGVASRKMMLVK
jgi:hypothetical protein